MNIQKGEAILLKSNKSFEDRVKYVNENIASNSDVVIIKNRSISIEDVRAFQDDFQKSSSEINLGFKKLGILIFDDISIPASNSLLKVLENMDKENCIILYTNKNVQLLLTILSRVIQIDQDDKSISDKKINKPVEPSFEDKDNLPNKQDVIDWIKYKIEISKINKDKQPLIWVNNPSPNMKYIVEYVNLFY
jgi:DNA polymerase III gamma/tau subunit